LSRAAVQSRLTASSLFVWFTTRSRLAASRADQRYPFAFPGEDWRLFWLNQIAQSQSVLLAKCRIDLPLPGYFRSR